MDTPDDSVQSLGGQARAKSLTPEQRSEIARSAALAKWEKSMIGPKVPKANFGSPDRPLRIGDVEVGCYVLDDGRRVITQAGVLTALTMSPGTATKGGGDRITNFINTKSIKPFASSVLVDMITEPIKFRPPSGGVAYGYDATILPEICEAVLKARKGENFNYQQEHIAVQCEALLLAFAKVGIIALVDEATGYQDVRDREALQEVLKKYIDGALYAWTATFPLTFYKELFRLRGWPWNNGKMPPVVGKYVNDLVYNRLAPGVLAELQRVNPTDDEGHRKHKHHQYLTRDLGHPALKERLFILIGMQRASRTWQDFYKLVDRDFPRIGATIPMQFDDEN